MSERELLNKALLTINQLNGRLKELVPETSGKEQLNHLGQEHGIDDDIAIVGMSCQFPEAKNIKVFWEKLCKQFDGVSHYPASRLSLLGIQEEELETKLENIYGGYLEDIELFDPALFKISPREARCMDPQQRLLMLNVHQALFDAGLLEQPDLRKTGVFISHYASEYAPFYADQYDKESALFFAAGNASSISANRISYLYDLQGPSLLLDTACSSSLVAVDIACEYLRKGSIDFALVGGVSLNLNPYVTQVLQDSGMLSTDGKCKTFDQTADGYVPGEGVGVIVLQRAKEAKEKKAKIYSLIAGSSINQDGKSNGLTAPNGVAQEELIKQAFHNAGIDPKTAQYIETHGTGTYLGDPVEIESLVNALNKTDSDDKQTCFLGCLKTNIGHLEPAAGIAGLIKASLCLYQGKIPANNHLKNINPLLKFDQAIFTLPEEITEWPEKEKIAGVSSFGFGGVNGHVVLKNNKENHLNGSINLVDQYPVYEFNLKPYWLSNKKIAENHTDKRISKNIEFLSFEFIDSPTDFLRVRLTANDAISGINDTGNFHIGFYIESIYKIFSKYIGVNKVYIKKIDFLKALLISKKETTLVDVVIKEIKKGDGARSEFSIDFYFKHERSGSSWEMAARANVLPYIPSEVKIKSFKSINEKESQSLTEDEFYKKYQSIGYPVDGFIRSINAIDLYGKESIANLKLSFSDESYTLGMHPGAIDAAVQPAIIMQGSLFAMTSSMEGIGLYRSLYKNNRYILHNQLLTREEENKKEFSTAWTIHDSNNEVFIHCEKAILQQVGNDAVVLSSDYVVSPSFLLDKISNLLEVDPSEVNREETLINLGMDSIMIMSLMEMLGDINLSVNQLFEITINELIALILVDDEDRFKAKKTSLPLVDYSLNKEKWIRGIKKENSKIRLYCFPHGYSSSSIFKNWVDGFPDEVEVRPIELPGRGARYKEKPIEYVEEMAESFIQVIQDDLERPYAFFGNSIGSLMAYVTTLYLKKRKMPMPKSLIVSAFTAPFLPNPILKMIRGNYRLNGLSSLPAVADVTNPKNTELINRVVDIVMDSPQGFGLTVDQDTALSQLPVIVAAKRMADTFNPDVVEPISIPIVSLHGNDDVWVSQDEMNAWSELTDESFSSEVFPGDHHFMNPDQSEERVISFVKNLLLTRL